MNVLVLCTGNSARSILGEALFNKLGNCRIQAYSAGSKPTGKVNPFAIKLLNNKGYDTEAFRSKNWDDFSAKDAPAMDLVITVCGNAAGETCPVWIGAPITVHWGFPDPAAVTGTDLEILAAFEATYEGLKRNIEATLKLGFDSMSPADIKTAMLDIHSHNQ